MVVGNFAVDRIVSPKMSTPKTALGGPPTYASLSARNLNANVAVISKVGDDFPNDYLAWLRNKGIDVSYVKLVENASTTRFTLRYTGQERQLRLEASAPKIFPEDVPENVQAKAVLAAPIVDEMPLETFNKLRRATETLALDPQGFVRGFDKHGNVRMRRWSDQRMLERVDVYKSSVQEIRMVTGTADPRLAMKKIHDFGVKVVLVTKGAKGSTLSFEGNLHEVPACSPRKVTDPTGAGDVFFGAFLAEYVRGKDPVWCAYLGSAAASFIVEEVGPTSFGSREEVYARALKAYEGKT